MTSKDPSQSDLAPLNAALRAGDSAAARTLVARFHRRFPAFAPLMRLGFNLAVKDDDKPSARRYGDAMLARPGSTAVDAFNLGFALKNAGLYADAAAAYNCAIERGISGAHEAYNNKGVIEADFLLDIEAAKASFTAAIKRRPDDIAAYLNRGNLYEEFGDFDAAIDNYQAAVDACAQPYEALARLGHCARIDKGEHPLIAQIKTAADDADATPLERESLLIALGHIYDGLGDYKAAFGAFQRANQTASPAYDRAAEAAKFAAIKDAFPVHIFKTPSGEQTPPSKPQPIFICGMFRSGSTLFEQVISGHGDVTPCGEIGFFDALIRRPDFAMPSGQPIPQARLENWRNAYWAAPLIDAVTTPVFTDKRPDNFLYLGLIKQMFPSAKIAVTQRAARDNALSLYFTQFGDGQAYARNLDDIAHYQGLLTDLMAHWRHCFGQDIITADYDAFIKEPEAHGHALMMGLDLEFTPDCLAIDNRKNRVKTASYKQVRQKLYRTSSGRAENYAFAFK